MSELERLIEELCPNGVIYKKISDIAETFIGLATSVTKYKAENGVLLLHNSDIKDGKIVVKNIEYITEDFARRNSKKILRKNDVITIHTGDVGTSAVITSEYDGTIGFTTISSRIRNREEITPEFLCKYLNSHLCKEQITSKTISDRNNLNLASFDELLIPVPPLPVQQEIVRILDNFTELTAELIAELTAEVSARKKQYEYHKHLVFETAKNKQIMHITDIALLKARVGWQRLTRAEYLETGDYFLITGTDFLADGHINFDSCVFVTKERYEMDENIIVHKDDILITKDGTLGKIAILEEEPIKPTTLNSGVFRVKLNQDIVIPRYMYHYFTSKYFKDFVESVKTGSTIPHLTQQGLVTLDIPIPSLEEQQRIVIALDHIDTLYNDISVSLSDEYAARQKQYEYYRDKLLTFKELPKE
ncbi:MAG: restriction endonuclease subunit S [Erysipelotrichales bacterium]|nr:restriction endonuclease subunit S [Erysipelotrichales bacterium]